MVFALGAGKLFDLDREGEFEDTIISKCVDTYIALSGTAPPSNSSHPPAQLTTAFPSVTNGASSTSASLASPTTPFSQSTLPSKSLLSRQGSSTFDPSLQAGGALAGLPPSVVSQSSVQRQLNEIINQLFERCYREGRYRQVVGIAVEARKLDVLRRTILRASEDEKRENKPADTDMIGRGEELMEYVLEICMDVVQEHGLRNEVKAPIPIISPTLMAFS